jgi:positive regulator of sigma E activity
VLCETQAIFCMQDTKTIEHKGFIKSIENGLIKVSILAQSACASCHAKGGCSVSDVQDKTIEIYNNSDSYQVGENVNVILEQKLGFKALFLGYVLPFIIVLTSLIILSVLTKNEALSGLVSLGLLIPYYIGLYSQKEKLKKIFSFKIEKLN